MRVPLSWLREFVDVDLSPEQLAERLTLLGMEVSAIERIGDDWQRVVVGELLEVAPHPNSGRLSLTRVRVGDGEPELSIVCGATNIAAGQRVPVALPGSVLPGDRRIEVTSIAGVASQGMLCSGDELGLSSDADGILILPDDTPVGLALAELAGDVVLDVDVKPNRGDALSILGLAREVAAATGSPLRWPDLSVTESGDRTADHLAVEVEDPDLCPRFVGRYVDGVRVGPSPWHVQRRLIAAGVRPISNVVDASNYVLLELGKPIHTFDADAVSDGHIVVRRARPGERLETLDHVERELTPETLLIADPRGPLAIAGVMGGAASEVGEQTRNVIVESAIFDPVSIRRTAFRTALRSEASLRFEKGQEHRMALVGCRPDRRPHPALGRRARRRRRRGQPTAGSPAGPRHLPPRPRQPPAGRGHPGGGAARAARSRRDPHRARRAGSGRARHRGRGARGAGRCAGRRGTGRDRATAPARPRHRGRHRRGGRPRARLRDARRPPARTRPCRAIAPMVAARSTPSATCSPAPASWRSSRTGSSVPTTTPAWARRRPTRPRSGPPTPSPRPLGAAPLAAARAPARRRGQRAAAQPGRPRLRDRHPARVAGGSSRPNGQVLGIILAGRERPLTYDRAATPVGRGHRQGPAGAARRAARRCRLVYEATPTRDRVEHPGRTAAVVAVTADGGRAAIGRVGELHPGLLARLSTCVPSTSSSPRSTWGRWRACARSGIRVGRLDALPGVDRDIAVVVPRSAPRARWRPSSVSTAAPTCGTSGSSTSIAAHPSGEGERSLAYRLRFEALDGVPQRGRRRSRGGTGGWGAERATWRPPPSLIA